MTATVTQALATFADALRAAIDRRFPDARGVTIAFEPPRRPEFGDFSTNAAFAIAREAKAPPQVVASALIADVQAAQNGLRALFDRMEATGGFINLRMAAECWHGVIREILQSGTAYGNAPRNARSISLEFGSANPTGPLVVVQGRTCSIGATLAEVMRARGYDVFVEWIVNDAGAQIETLGRSLYARYVQCFDEGATFPDEGYPGEYLIDIARAIAEREGNRWTTAPEEQWLPYFSEVGRDALVRQQQATVERFGVHFDLWQSERELHESGRVAAGIRRLQERGTTYDRDGALYFRATDYGDDKDRVLIRRDGRPTYFCADVAYHYDKLQRSDKVIDILGPDHHGYIGRLKGLAEALGYDRDHLEALIAQQITLMRGDQQVSISKRAGQIVTLDDIIDEVGVDAARFFFVMLAPESPLTFDLQLAKERSNDNPVYYVQYGYTRIASVLKIAAPDDIHEARTAESVDQLRHPSEIALMRRLYELPGLLQNVIDQLAPHRLTKFARDVAAEFHQFYTECRILTDEDELRSARLSLCLATQSVLARVLALLGVSAPETM